MGHTQIWGEAIKTTCISGPSHLQERVWNTPLQEPGGLRMTNVDPKNLWLYQGLRGRHVSGGRAGRQRSGGEKEETERWKTDGEPTTERPSGETRWVGSDRHVSHRPTAPSIAPGWPLWLTASRWRMNRVVRTTVSQSQIATATRALAEQAQLFKVISGYTCILLAQGGWGASDHAKITINASNTVKQMMIGTPPYTAGQIWCKHTILLYLFFKKEERGKREILGVLTMNLGIFFFHFLSSP